MSAMSAIPLYQEAPVVAEAIAEDVIYAFACGWLELPASVMPGEASERLSRLYAVQRFAIETVRLPRERP